MNARIDGPGIAGKYREDPYVGRGPYYFGVLITPDANHSEKSNSSTTPDKFSDWANWVQRETEKQHDAKVRAYYKAIVDEATQSAVNAATKPTPETGEATDWELLAIWRKPGAAWVCLREVYRLGVAHGEAKICKRLPRLWGILDMVGDWRQPDGVLALCSERVREHFGDSDYIREFDPRTGGPKA